MKVFTVPVANGDDILLLLLLLQGQTGPENLRSLVVAVYDVQQAVLVPLIGASSFS